MCFRRCWRRTLVFDVTDPTACCSTPCPSCLPGRWTSAVFNSALMWRGSFFGRFSFLRPLMCHVNYHLRLVAPEGGAVLDGASFPPCQGSNKLESFCFSPTYVPASLWFGHLYAAGRRPRRFEFSSWCLSFALFFCCSFPRRVAFPGDLPFYPLRCALLMVQEEMIRPFRVPIGMT